MILVTGGTGLVGAQLLFDLTRQGKAVTAIHRKSSNHNIVSKTFINHPHLLSKIKWIEADLLDIESLNHAIKNIEFVYHCAAFVSFNKKDANKVLEININGTANLVNICLQNEVQKFFHVSSVASLGNDLIDGKITENSVFKSRKNNSTYAISKHGAEREVWRAQAEGLRCLVINPTIILGRGDWRNGSSAVFNKIYKGFPFYTSGSHGFVDVRDVTGIMIKLMESEIEGERFIVSSENMSYKNLFTEIAIAFNKKPPTIKPPKWLTQLFWRFEYLRSIISGDPPVITKETINTAMRNSYYSNKKIKEALDFEFIPIKKTIQHTCKLFLTDLSNAN